MNQINEATKDELQAKRVQEGATHGRLPSVEPGAVS